MVGAARDWVFAVDLDGTLVRRDHTIAPDDAEALHELVARGTPVVLATGRFPGGVQEVRRVLGRRFPAACVDGAIVLDDAGACVESHVVAATVVDAFVTHAGALGLRCFAFGRDHVVCAACHADHLAYVEGWARGHRVELRARAGDAASMVLALGERAAVEGLAFACDASVVFDRFALGSSGVWAGRLRHVAADKGTAVRAWARRLAGVNARIVAVGNDDNDLPLFRVADRSFAMADAPAHVRAAATRVLRADAMHGGGVAEACAWIRRDLGGAGVGP